MAYPDPLAVQRERRDAPPPVQFGVVGVATDTPSPSATPDLSDMVPAENDAVVDDGTIGDPTDPANAPPPSLTRRDAGTAPPASFGSKNVPASLAAITMPVKVMGYMTPAQKTAADLFISWFAFGSQSKLYDRCEDMGDGKGLTCGSFGFTTGDGDAQLVVQHYQQLAPSAVPPSSPLLSPPPVSAAAAPASTDDPPYCTAWETAAADAQFQQAQDDIANVMYFAPAMALADQYGVKRPLTRLLFYDTFVQHGAGSGPNSITALLTATSTALGGSPQSNPQVTEDQFFAKLAQLRSTDLLNGGIANQVAPYLSQADSSHFSLSDDRVQCLLNLQAAANWNLVSPVQCTVAGQVVSIAP
ncbi:hypothetical protein RI367_004840 [Sorochytrium milnesiophthora]